MTRQDMLLTRVANSWVTYFLGRHQSVCINGAISIFRPILYLIYMEDMHHADCQSTIYQNHE